jgi:hypothetical protein
MLIHLLDDSVTVNVYYECNDSEFEDNICVSFREDCPAEEKIFLADETNIYLTREQALKLASALLQAAEKSCDDPGKSND